MQISLVLESASFRYFFWLCFLALSWRAFAEPNPPQWPSNVKLLHPDSPTRSQAIIEDIYSENGGHSPPFHGQWSSNHYALLFLPGSHDVNVNVGFYTSVIGLGQARKDTLLAGLNCDNGDFNFSGGALSNFWRSAENLAVADDVTWAVSQASPLRRVHINGNLALWQYNSGCCAGYASGGFAADSVITGTVTSGSQQQWLMRNSYMTGWSGGVWNMAFLGDVGGAPTRSHCAAPKPFTVMAETPVIAEKPYFFVDSVSGRYTLRIPRAEFNKAGPTPDDGGVFDDVDFSLVYVTSPTDTAAQINFKLSAGLHVIITPGIYHLEASLRVRVAGTVVLGIGFPVLIASAGVPALVVSNVDNVRIGGILFQAGRLPSKTLVQWGVKQHRFGYYPGNPTLPGFLYDAFARVGGTNDPSVAQMQTSSMLLINSGNVVIDNAWLWRADHDITGLVKNSQNPVQHGLIVNGDSVSAYGLAVEHTLQDLVQWNGNNGVTFFFQSELPYDVNQANFGDLGYAGYRIAAGVPNHQLFAGGVYTFFRDFDVNVGSVVVVGDPDSPIPPGVRIVNALAVHLNGFGSTANVVNQLGGSTNNSSRLMYLCHS